MRKWAVALTALLLASIAGLHALHGGVSAWSDGVQARREILQGAGDAAQGVELRLRAVCDRRMVWTVSCDLGDPGAARAEYAFTQNPLTGSAGGPSYAELNAHCNFGMSSDATLEPLSDEPAYMAAPAQALADRTPAGESAAARMDLSDYYEYYPMQLDVVADGQWVEITEEAQRTVSECFRVPVPKGEWAEVSVKRDAAGNLVEVDVSTDARPSSAWATVSAVDARACFLAIAPYSAESALDFSQMREGYALYELPLEWQEERGTPAARVDQLRAVYPLERDALLQAVQLSRDGKELYLLTREGGGFCLTVLNRETAAVKQKVTWLAAAQSDERVSLCWEGEDFLVCALNSDRAAVLARGGDGRYEAAFAVDLQQAGADFPYAMLRGGEFFFDGDRLVAAGFADPAGERPCDVALAVWGLEGLRGVQRWSVNLNDAPPLRRADRVQPAEENALHLASRQ